MSNYFHKYFFLFGKNQQRLIPLIILILVSSLLDIMGIGLIGPFISILTNPESLSNNTFWLRCSEIFGISNFNQGIILIGLVIIFSFYIKAFIGFWVRKYIITFSLFVQSDSTSRLMSAYQNMPYQFHLKRNTSSLILSTSSHTSTFSHHTLMSSLDLISEAIVVLMILALLGTINLYVTMCMVILLGIVYLLYDRIIKDRVKKAGKDVANASEGIIQGVKQGIEGFKEIRVYGKEHYFNKVVKDSTVSFANVSSYYGGLKIIPRYLFESTIISFVIGMSIFSIKFYQTPMDMFPILGTFAIAAVRLVPSSNRITQALISIRFSSFAMNELYRDINEINNNKMDFLDYKSLENQQSNYKFQVLNIDNISYRYPDKDVDAISNLTMSIEDKKSIGIIGKTGSGKTTLINILLGFFTPQKGVININGIPLQNDLRGWLDLIAYIPQDVFILDDTIESNIALGIPEDKIDKGKLEKSIKVAQLQDVIEKLPEKIKTVVGERGIRLSGGERQRLALARAFYHERQVIVMDEATAALDNETEENLVKAINELKMDRTMIIIAHRLSTLKDCDMIYRIDNGQIIDSGDYNSVIGN